MEEERRAARVAGWLRGRDLAPANPALPTAEGLPGRLETRGSNPLRSKSQTPEVPLRRSRSWLRGKDLKLPSASGRRSLLPWVCLWWSSRRFAAGVQILPALSRNENAESFVSASMIMVAGPGFSGGEPAAAYWCGFASAGRPEPGVQILCVLRFRTKTPGNESRRSMDLVAGEGFEPSTFGL